MSQIVRYTHNTKNPRLRYTVAYSFDKTADGQLNVSFGIAQCSKADTFSRAAGRKMAEARLNKAFKGKQAPITNPVTGAATVPMYGQFSVADEPGLSVSKLVAKNFEAKRVEALEINNQYDANVAVLRDLGLIPSY